MEDCRPLVSIGLATYDRVYLLKRAVESVLAQDYPHLELVISDNASTDETPLMCEAFCRRDRRVRYLRQPTKIGPVANYAEAFGQARGELYMALGDDDWLAPNYVSEGVKALLQDPDLVLVCGNALMFNDDELGHEGVKTFGR